MKNLIYLFIIAFSFLACNTQSETNTNTVNEVTNEVAETQNELVSEVLSPVDFKAKMTNTEDYYLIDVRTEQELVEIPSIEGAVNYDIYGNDFIKNLESLDANKPVFVYCRSGKRSAQAAKQLEQLGFIEVYDLAGGITAWQTKMR